MLSPPESVERHANPVRIRPVGHVLVAYKLPDPESVPVTRLQELTPLLLCHTPDWQASHF